MPENEKAKAEELLPWQRAVKALMAGDPVLSGPWNWRLYQIPDSVGLPTWSGTELSDSLACLIALGEEFSVSVWRPFCPVHSDATEWRLALVTWGEFLDMNREDIVESMIESHRPVRQPE